MSVSSNIEDTVMEKRFILFLFVISIAAILVGCGRKQIVTTTAAAPPPIPNVTVARVSRSSVSEIYEAAGTVNAKTTTQISANLLGRVNSISVSEGERVKKGQLLVEIDAREALAQIEKSQAGLREAEGSLLELDDLTAAANAVVKTAAANKQLGDATLARYNELYQRRSVSGQEYDEALSRSNAATSELERAKANVRSIFSRKVQINARISQAKADIANSKVIASYSRIVSPVSGVVVKKFIEPGATASPGVPLLSIEDSSQYRMEAFVAESHSKLVHIGAHVDVRIDAVGGGDIAGTVSEVLPTTDAASRSYMVKIDLPANPLLRTGLYGLARFPVHQKTAITIPKSAMVTRGQLAGVYIVGSDGTVRFRLITTGTVSEGIVEVLSGLNEGDEVAITAVEKLNEGTKVR
jgi:membrane fusion protein, multidrug efflux system